MCGIVGFILGSGSKVDLISRQSVVQEMLTKLSHRGPDDYGYWLDKQSSLSFGHTRLSINDLSAAGHQPMKSHSGRYILTFNGEIYNHLDLRLELDGIRPRLTWFGSSDTETLVECIDAWGLERTLQKIDGMFAFALYDRLTTRISLVRDRFGEKPLYYGWVGNDFIFSSDLFPIKSYPGFDKNISKRALTEFFRFGSIPAPYSIFSKIFKLEPSTIVYLDINKNSFDKITKKSYWNAQINHNLVDSRNENELTGRIEELFEASVNRRLRADVQVGCFLSGGVDSSLVAAYMQKKSHKPIPTFTIGFEFEATNEAPVAKKISNYIGTDHHEEIISEKNALEIIPNIAEIYSEPFADSSQIPSCLISSYASRHVKVVQTGDGGDELFGGYNRHVWADKMWRFSRLLPKNMPLMDSYSQNFTRDIIYAIGKNISPLMRISGFDEKFKKAMIATRYDSFLEYYKSLLGNGDASSLLFNINDKIRDHIDRLYDDFEGVAASRNSLIYYLDVNSYLPNDILAKVDRSTMGFGLEARAPFLDHRLYEFAMTIPDKMKVRGRNSKWVLRQMHKKYFPREICSLPKSGFSVPLAYWLRNGLKEWASQALSTANLSASGFLDVPEIDRMWAQHLDGAVDHSAHLWKVLMFQSWYFSQ